MITTLHVIVMGFPQDGHAFARGYPRKKSELLSHPQRMLSTLQNPRRYARGIHATGEFAYELAHRSPKIPMCRIGAKARIPLLREH